MTTQPITPAGRPTRGGRPAVPSWRRVAEILAERVGYAAGAAGSFSPGDPGEHQGCSHSVAEADPDNCPFCADRAAYQLFQRKAAQR